MENKVNANLKIGFGASVLLLIISSLVSYICIDRLLISSTIVRHTNELTRHLEQVVSAIKEAETAQRGFLMTDNAVYLEPFDIACEHATQHLDEALRLVRDNPIQQKTGIKLKEALEKRIDRMNIMLDTKRKAGVVDELDMELGRTHMEEVRSLATQMINEEDMLLVARTATLDKFAMYTPIVIVIAALLAIIISIIFYIRVINDMTARGRLQESLQQQDVETKHRIEVIQAIASQISEGNYTIRINDEEKDALGSLAGSLNRMATALRVSFEKLQNNEWLQSGLATLNEQMMGEKQVESICEEIINFLVVYTQSKTGSIYLFEKDELVLQCGYALQPKKAEKIKLGQGIAGQSLLDRKAIVLEDITEESIIISHASGEIKPRGIVAFPIFHEQQPIGVVELAALTPFTEFQLEFFNAAAQNIGSAMYGAQSRKQLQELLEETQAQAEELQAQHDELEGLNSKLEAHAQKLQSSEEELRAQQEELQQNNAELEERNHMIRERNAEIMKKAEELQQSTQYKTEFMANMSHELRTPLNSILLLSRYLSENSEKNLTEDQMESASVIFNSGNSLLQLIDELLDLSKIEAGKMDLEYNKVNTAEVLYTMDSLFTPVAKEKNIQLQLINELPPDVYLEADKMKLEQILKNLLSNALKFTAKGHVSLTVRKSLADAAMLEFVVQDSGIGIPADKLAHVFEAFTQADGSTKRKYGGTGLGLSISRQLARLLGGEITVSSEPDKGSIFTLALPLDKPQPEQQTSSAKHPTPQASDQLASGRPLHLTSAIPPAIPDDRNNLTPDDNVILIVEDDTTFAKALLQVARRKGYKGVVAVRGNEAMDLVNQYNPCAVLLDIQLPIKDGWEIMEELKSNPQTRHIPVHVISSMEVKRESRKKGAVAFSNKPLSVEDIQDMFSSLETLLSKNPKKVLIIEENAKHAEALAYFLESSHISTVVKHSIDESITSLQNNEVECVILDMGIPASAGYDTLETVKRNPGLEDLPIIVFTGKSLSISEEMRIKQYADSIVLKTAHSYQRIIDEITLFLHLLENQRKEVSDQYTGFTDVLHGKTILVTDDDVRNIFSLTKTLEKHRMVVISAIDGTDALEKLERHPETDIILMDMMMPHMDGYQSTAKIKQDERFKDIPVIALTAKAMLGDREQCISAGASDYISKPVDLDQLVSLLRVWLYSKNS